MGIIKDAIKEGAKEGVKGVVRDTVKGSIEAAILVALKAKFGEDAVPENIIRQQLERITSKDQLAFLKKTAGQASSLDDFLKVLKKMAT